MSSDQVAEIVPFVREVYAAFHEPKSNSRVELCATLEVASKPEAWLQVTVGMLNFAYPSEALPEVKLQSILQSLPCGEVLDWVPLRLVTIGFEAIEPLALARVIDALFTLLFDPGDYSIDGTLERIPSA
jgi:hypothetical protein